MYLKINDFLIVNQSTYQNLIFCVLNYYKNVFEIY